MLIETRRGKQIKNKIIWSVERLPYFLNNNAAFTFNFNIWQCRLGQNISKNINAKVDMFRQKP